MLDQTKQYWWQQSEMKYGKCHNHVWARLNVLIVNGEGQKIFERKTVFVWGAKQFSLDKILGLLSLCVIFSRDPLTRSNFSVDIMIFLPIHPEGVTWRYGCVPEVVSEGQRDRIPVWTCFFRCVPKSWLNLAYTLVNLAKVLLNLD